MKKKIQETLERKNELLQLIGVELEKTTNHDILNELYKEELEVKAQISVLRFLLN